MAHAAREEPTSVLTATGPWDQPASSRSPQRHNISHDSRGNPPCTTWGCNRCRRGLRPTPSGSTMSASWTLSSSSYKAGGCRRAAPCCPAAGRLLEQRFAQVFIVYSPDGEREREVAALATSPGVARLTLTLTGGRWICFASRMPRQTHARTLWHCRTAPKEVQRNDAIAPPPPVKSCGLTA